ncbi:MAG: hypothetical protein AAB834_01870 [Patescibacteria group bacterium]
MDDNNELIIYILQQLRQGVPEQAVRNVLAQNGWPQPLVDRAFSMVQQARPHDVTPAFESSDSSLPQAQPQEPELPAPSEDPYPAIEEEKKLEKRSNRRRTLLALVFVVFLAMVGSAIFFASRAIAPAPKKETQKTVPNPDNQRRDRLNALATELTSHYKEKGTYPTLAEINSPEFATSKHGFDSTKYRDPAWDPDSKRCVDDKGRAVFLDTRAETCLTYRVTALSGEDCDGLTKKCTRVVLTVNLQDKKPYIVALDQNKKE